MSCHRADNGCVLSLTDTDTEDNAADAGISVQVDSGPAIKPADV